MILTFAGERVRGRYALFQTRRQGLDDPPHGPAGDPARAVPGAREADAGQARDAARDESGWAFEIKWDGVRAVATADGGSVRLESRNLRDVTAQYPEVRRLGDASSARVDVVLDGELVAFDDEGRPDFQRLQGRIHPPPMPSCAAG